MDETSIDDGPNHTLFADEAYQFGGQEAYERVMAKPRHEREREYNQIQSE